jgi:DNA-binding Lrp family transcriptional regulator
MPLAFVFVECEDGYSSTVKNLTEKIDGVQEAHSISGGDYDIEVKVNTRDYELDAALAAIRHIVCISALSTSIICKCLT